MRISEGTISKNALINQIASKCSLDSRDVKEVLSKFEEAILENIDNNYDVRLGGFLTFEIIKVAQRVGLNKRTGQQIKIDSQKRVNVKISDAFQKKINQY